MDLWTYRRNIAADFIAGNQPDQELVIEPANARETITVAAWISRNHWTDCGDRFVGYDSPWDVGALALFSSPGPTRDGRPKPEIAAPGFEVASSNTFDRPFACDSGMSAFVNDGMEHVISEGTSMSAPMWPGRWRCCSRSTARSRRPRPRAT